MINVTNFIFKNSKLFTTVIYICLILFSNVGFGQHQPIKSTQSVFTCAWVDDYVCYSTGFFVSYKRKKYFITNWFYITGREPASYHFRDPSGKKRTPVRLSIYLTPKGDTIVNRFDIVIKRDPWIEFYDENRFTYDVVAAELPNSFPAADFDIEYYNLDGIRPRALKNGERLTAYGYTSHSEYSQITKLDITVCSSPYFDEARQGMPKFFSKQILKKGMSGSPLFDRKGMLVGIFSSEIGLSKGDFGIFWSLEAIRTVLDKGHLMEWDRLPK